MNRNNNAKGRSKTPVATSSNEKTKTRNRVMKPFSVLSYSYSRSKYFYAGYSWKKGWIIKKKEKSRKMFVYMNYAVLGSVWSEMNVLFLNVCFISYICIINTLSIFLFAYTKVDNLFEAWHNFVYRKTVVLINFWYSSLPLSYIFC